MTFLMIFFLFYVKINIYCTMAVMKKMLLYDEIRRSSVIWYFGSKLLEVLASKPI